MALSLTSIANVLIYIRLRTARLFLICLTIQSDLTRSMTKCNKVGKVDLALVRAYMIFKENCFCHHLLTKFTTVAISRKIVPQICDKKYTLT